jgi:phosphatidylglycerol:prolipoprotein diacylglycerol transferase
LYPILFEIKGFPISTFGVMLAIAFLVGTWIASIRMREEELDSELATTLLMYAMVGGIGGSKLYWAIDVSIRTGDPFLSLLLMRDGITYYGGLIGGTLAVWLGCRFHGVPPKPLSSCVAPALAVGQALGRIGCFLVGDDYGQVTAVPWGIAFPRGAPPTLEAVHPTQLYEMLWLFGVAGLLWRRRRTSPFLFGEYLALNGFGRFWIEWVRVNEPVALGLTEPQWIGIALVIVGSAMWIHYRKTAEGGRAASP